MFYTLQCTIKVVHPKRSRKSSSYLRNLNCRRLFMEQQLPALFRQMRLLGITQEELLKVLHSLKYY